MLYKILILSILFIFNWWYKSKQNKIPGFAKGFVSSDNLFFVRHIFKINAVVKQTGGENKENQATSECCLEVECYF